jgi:nucleoside-diphosphate-sugar epimerase
MAHERVFLVTGALGCIGAWVLHHLVKAGETVVSFDLADGGHRVNMLLSPEERARVRWVVGDLAQPQSVLQAFEAHGITHVIHLAALQVPFCKKDPILGAQVNVVGTVNVFEAARRFAVPHLALASSIAIYGTADRYPAGLLRHDAPPAPATLYGVYKLADEGIARVYWQDHNISSTTLRPYTVYGLGRDAGLTSEPTKAMLAAVKGEPYAMSFGGTFQMQWASDVAQQFIAAASTPLMGAHAFNLGGDVVHMRDVVEAIRAVIPQADVSFKDERLIFPEGFDDSELRRHLPVYATPLSEGVRATLHAMQALVLSGDL